ncbi:uncharacterized protein BCR38DRAFT_394279 [Pseudomassariella vexata]|uniref:DUF7704 domain-containing protein n=1 Tax=Pseudomassariella vexata TaxID=1141098 RepID=A0A1Y2DXM9_9PEZI|nr:uncharacterized protein BCR38DRAFT_394279 [Pseudomassariella vexata]ORY63385.1 hypothetical protein BCR38DRAFT_394279 [Pseudomassariella vexata]
MSPPIQTSFKLPIPYRLFFLIIEPISALVGAYFAHFKQTDYLTLTHAPTAADLLSQGQTSPIPTGVSIIMSQLANLYLLFALNEALVLRSTGDQRVWKTVLFVLLLADFGHLYSVSGLGWRVYWDVREWNAIDWGNVPFVYFGASMRIAFLAGVGLGGEQGGKGVKAA